MRRHGKLAASVDADDTEHPERAQHDVALQQRTVVAEKKVVRAADRDSEAAISRKTIVNRLDVGHDSTRFGIG